MYILAMESSCDETSASVVYADEAGRLFIKSNIIASQVETHRLYGGVVPEIASRAHIEAVSSITYEALDAAGISLSDVGLVAVTDHPGLIGALLVGVNFAKSLAFANNIPLVAVDHIKGHIAASYLQNEAQPDFLAPKPPYVALVVSGGHTSVYHVESYTEHTVAAETRDDAIGESFDKIGRLIGIPYPAGAGFDKLSAEGFRRACGDVENAYELFAKSPMRNKNEWKLPSPALAGERPDFSFSGLKTAACNLLHKYEQNGEELPRDTFAAAYTYEAVEAVAKQISIALDMFDGEDLVVAGGVAANSHLRRRLARLCEKKKRKLHIPPLSLCGDNGAMIAAQGYYEFLAGHLAGSDLNASAFD